MASKSCSCGAMFVASTQEAVDQAYAEHQYTVHDMSRPVEVNSKENENVETEQPKVETQTEQPKVETQPEQPKVETQTEQPKVETQTEQPKPTIPPPPLAMVEALIMQLESAMGMIKVPDYVESSAKAFTDSLRKWAEEGK